MNSICKESRKAKTQLSVAKWLRLRRMRKGIKASRKMS